MRGWQIHLCYTLPSPCSVRRRRYRTCLRCSSRWRRRGTACPKTPSCCRCTRRRTRRREGSRRCRASSFPATCLRKWRTGCVKQFSLVLCTVWGGRLWKRFCEMFSETSAGSWAVLQLPCCPSKQYGNFQNTFFKTFLTTCRPSLYRWCTIPVGIPCSWSDRGKYLPSTSKMADALNNSIPDHVWRMGQK